MFFSRKEDNGLQEVIADIEEVVQAAQGLREVSKIIKDLTIFGPYDPLFLLVS